MPLTRQEIAAPGNTDAFSLRWPMMDGSEEVMLKVSTQSLRDLAGWDGRDRLTHPRELWDHYRDELEAFASRRYDQRGRPDGELLILAAQVRGN